MFDWWLLSTRNGPENPCLANVGLSSEARLVRPFFVCKSKPKVMQFERPSSPPSGFPSTGSIEKSEICEHRMIPDLQLRHSDLICATLHLYDLMKIQKEKFCFEMVK